MESASEVARVLYLPTALEINTFAHGQAEMIKIKIPEHNIMHDKSIASLGKDIFCDILICAIERNGKVFIPSGNFILKAGDLISFTASRKNARLFLQKVGFATNQVKDTMIIGGGRVAYYLAKQLINMGIEVKIIENDFKRCEELSELLPKAIIINGDGTDEEILKEEGLQTVQSFVPLTGIDEENILLTLHAKQNSNAKVITKINRLSFKNVISSLDLGSVIYPRYITSEAIVAYVRAKKDSQGSNIETLYHLFDSRAEAIEFKIGRQSEVTDKTLMELNLKDNLLITLINRNGSIIIPRGSSRLMLGDTVVVVTTHTGFNDIDDILK
jgi:trk system potassium uptake protein TrkA